MKISKLINKFIQKLAIYHMNYDEAINLLGIPRMADKNEIKAAYKKSPVSGD